MRLRECSLLILTLLTVSLPAQASEWCPIDTGRFWVYSGYDGAVFSATIEDPELFAGSLVQPLQWDPGNRELYSQDEAGRVFGHGGDGSSGGSYYVFDPPVLRMDSELTPGHEWETVYDVIFYSRYGAEEERVGASMTYRVIGFGPVEVPAGTFHAAEVLMTREFGTLPTAAFREWYAEGVGWIRRASEDGTFVIFELESYGPTGVPTKATTWGAVKSLYKD